MADPVSFGALTAAAAEAYWGGPTEPDDLEGMDRVVAAVLRAVAGEKGDELRVERLCEVMHDAYEEAAQHAGWETQPRSRVPWAQVPEANKATMRVAVEALLRAEADRLRALIPEES